MLPKIDMKATGANLERLRRSRGLSVRDVQQYFGFEQPQAIYKWQYGQSLPSVEHLYALSRLLNTPMESILVEMDQDAVSFILASLHGKRFFPIASRSKMGYNGYTSQQSTRRGFP